MRRPAITTPTFWALALALLIGLPTSRASAEPEVLFTRHDGLSSAGLVVAAWAERAAFHGLADRVAPAPIDPIVAAYVADMQAGKPHHHDAQMQVERALATTLERLVAELPASPRTTPVLEDPKTTFYVSPDVGWLGAPARVAPPEALAAARQAALAGTLDDYLTSLLPKHAQYLRLVAAAVQYDKFCRAGGWKEIAKPKVPKGRRNWTPPADVAAAFRARLAAEGYLPPERATGAWDADTEAALASFRVNHQIPQKGIDEDDLLAALNVPCADRLATLELNVKRWRVSGWTDRPTWVEVNVAAQELRYLRERALVMQTRTIVGSIKYYFDTDLGRRLNLQATPVLSDEIASVVVNPTWAVPARIAKNEIDAEVAKDPTYLEKHRMQLVTSTRGRTYIQAPGADNALGVMKILFPNAEDIYLHDTPKKGAFKLAVRALSHGCVRVQNVVELGMALLSADAAASGKPFDEAEARARVGHGGTVTYELATPVPIFLEYYTASVDDAGQVRFHPDIYGYDEELVTPPGQRPRLPWKP